MKFNKYINKVGIEFEGIYNDQFLTTLQYLKRQDEIVNEIKGDGSVERRGERGLPFEVTTLPLNAGELRVALRLFGDNQRRGNYCLNSTTGLHFHISLNKSYYAIIDNQRFYTAFVKMFHKGFPEVYQDRRLNRYARQRHSHRHFMLESYSRYAFVNYCYAIHGTVEFRAYGGKYATIDELARLIQSTIDLIGSFIDKHEKKYKPITAIVEAKPNQPAQNYTPEVSRTNTREFNIRLSPPNEVESFTSPIDLIVSRELNL